MSRYIVRRLVQAVPIFFGITLLSWILMSAAGNPLQILTVFKEDAKPEERARVAALLGLNDPWPVQYIRWLVGDDWLRWDTNEDGIADQSFLVPLDSDGDGQPDAPGKRRGILRGDFGNSFALKRPVLDLIFERLPATLEINIPSLIIGLLVGVSVGILAAITRGGLIDNLIRVFAVILNAVPTFWLSLLLLLIFGSMLRVLPLGDRCRLTLEASCPPIWQRLEYLVLPLLIATIGTVAGLSRVMRASMLDVVGQDYIRVARAKGLRSRMIWLRHAARNALIPVATGLGPAITGLVGGSVIIEQIFNYPGVGRTLFGAAVGRDYPLVMASVIIAAVTTILGYLLSDILYAVIDPRIKFS